jgi:DNA polymerase III delta prime subunit
MEHHAYLYFADGLEASTVPEEYKTQSVDVTHITSLRFSIDDARELTRTSQWQPFEGSARVFVIVTNDVAIEAQNALLKLFEEPPVHAQFYLVLKPSAFLLPTLYSRLSVARAIGTDAGADSNPSFETFESSSYADRIATIAEKTKEKDSVWIEDIVRGCEVYTTRSLKNKTTLLQGLVFVRTSIGSKGASSKMLLEELALTLPVL